MRFHILAIDFKLLAFPYFSTKHSLFSIWSQQSLHATSHVKLQALIIESRSEGKCWVHVITQVYLYAQGVGSHTQLSASAHITGSLDVQAARFHGRRQQ